MATLQQLETALINADAAGDTEAATELAHEVGRMRREQSTAQGPVPEGDGLALNATAGLNQGIYNTLGAPVDFSRWLINKGIEGANALGADLPSIPSDSFGGSESISSMFGAVGVPEPKDIQALTPEERIARGVGEGVGYTVTPAGVVGGAARTGALLHWTVVAAAPPHHFGVRYANALHVFPQFGRLSGADRPEPQADRLAAGCRLAA